MKAINSTMLAFLLIYSMNTSATIWTVNNNTNLPNGGQFTEIDDAVAVASAGDTIYVHATQGVYADAHIDKALTIIGAGFKPDNQFGYTSRIQRIYLLTGSSGTKIIGFKRILSILAQSGESDINNITIERNHFKSAGSAGIQIKSTGTTENWYIRQNVFENSSILMDPKPNIYISNNVIDGRISGAQYSSNLILNNVFIDNSSTTALGNCKDATIENNIFYDATAGSSITHCDNCFFINNSTNNTNTDFFDYGTNSASGNLLGVDPMFVNVPITEANVNYDYTPTNSVLLGGGSDGTDIGITGGAYPFNLEAHGSPPIPEITETLMLTPIIQEGDNIEIQVKAKIQN